MVVAGLAWDMAEEPVEEVQGVWSVGPRQVAWDISCMESKKMTRKSTNPGKIWFLRFIDRQSKVMHDLRDE